MTEPPAQQPPVAFELRAEPSMEGGVYANGLFIWSSPHEFTLDFMVNASMPQPGETPEGEAVVHVPHRLVARVRIAPTAIFEIIRAMNENLGRYEQAFGPIRPTGPEVPLYPPDDLGDTGSGSPEH